MMSKLIDNILLFLSLRFDNPTIEQQYHSMMMKQQLKLLLLTNLCTVVMVLYDTIVTREAIPTSEDFFLRGALVIIGISALSLFKLSPKLQEYAVVLFGTLTIFYYCRLQYTFINPEKYDDFKKGISIDLLQVGLVLSVKKYWLRVLVQIFVMTIHLVFLNFQSSPFLFFMLLSFWVLQERLGRSTFKAMKESEDNLFKFKVLISEDLPASLVILDSELESIKFCNYEFKEQVKNKENLERIILNSDSEVKGFQEQEAFLSKIRKLRSQNAKQNPMRLKQQYTGTLNSLDSIKHFEIKVRKVLWDSKECFAMILDNITEKVNLIGVKKISEYKDQVIAAVSHEIRTPLNGIIGMVNIAASKCRDKEVCYYLKNSQSCANLLLNFVNSILDVSQIKAHKLKLTMSCFAIVDIIDLLNSIFLNQAEAKKILFEVICRPDVPKTLNSDKNRLLQILLNLITNAFKFTKEGSVTLLIERGDLSLNRIVFQIIDTGIGIKSPDVEKLFQQFGKLEQEDRNLNSSGVGLGLTISNELVKMLNGDSSEQIYVCSQFGQGSTFSFSIPIDRPQQTASQRSKDLTSTPEYDLSASTFDHPSDHALLPKYENDFKISPNQKSPAKAKSHLALVVDDTPFNLIAMSFQLEKLGLRVKTALSGPESIEMMKLCQFDIVFMDINMPGQDGLEASKEIKKLVEKGEVKKTPIIGLSAQTLDDRRMMEEVGMDDFLVKPILEMELKGLLARWVDH